MFFFRIMIALLFPAIAMGQSSSLRFTTAALAPHSRVKPGGMLALSVTVANTGAQASEGLVIATINDMDDQQSAREVLVRPGQQLAFEMLVHIPESVTGQDTANLTLTMMVDTGTREVVLDRNGVPVNYSLRLSVERLPGVAGIALDIEGPPLPDWYWPPASVYGSYELAVAARIDAGYSRKTASWELKPLPSGMHHLDSLDLLVLSEETMLWDAASRSAITQYLHRGGRVWVMLDQVPVDLVRGFLGSGQSCEVVDQVELDEFVVELRDAPLRLAEVDRTVSLEKPARFSRVVHSGGTVSHAIGGWPAAIRFPVGYGELVFTTLENRAWMEPRTEKVYDPLFASAFQSRIWAKQFAIELNQARRPIPMQAKVEYPNKLIGNPVVPRLWVLIALGGFCASILAAGACKWAGLDLVWMGALAPGLALLASAGLFLVSTLIRKDIPEGVSKLQIVEFNSDGSTATVREQAAMYLASGRAMALESTVDGAAIASPAVSSGIRQYRQDDFHTWQLNNSAWPPGPWRYQTEYALPTEKMVVSAKLSSTGVELHLPNGLPSALEDPVLCFVPGDPMLCQATEAGFHCDGSLAVDGQRWIGDAFVTDEQQRRIDIYTQYFEPLEGAGPLQKVLMGWTVPFVGGPKWNTELTTRGAALSALPVRLARPAPEQEILIPHGLIGLRRSGLSIGGTSVFSDSSGAWQSEMTMSINAKMKFIMPAEVLPLVAKELDIQFDINAPHRKVQVLAKVGESWVELASANSPSLPLNSTITDPDVLKELRDGTLEIELKVSDRTDVDSLAVSSNVVAWNIRYLRASVRGHVMAKR